LLQGTDEAVLVDQEKLAGASLCPEMAQDVRLVEPRVEGVRADDRVGRAGAAQEIEEPHTVTPASDCCSSFCPATVKRCRPALAFSSSPRSTSIKIADPTRGVVSPKTKFLLKRSRPFSTKNLKVLCCWRWNESFRRATWRCRRTT